MEKKKINQNHRPFPNNDELWKEQMKNFPTQYEKEKEEKEELQYRWWENTR